MSQDSTKAELFWKHLEPLQEALEAYCRRSVSDPNAAEDVLQGAIGKAFADFDLFVEGTNFRAWVFRYLNFEIRSANRKSLAKPHIELKEEPLEDCDDDEWILVFDEATFAALLQSPDKVLERCDDALAAAISGLGELERATLLLKAIGGFKYREIAEIVQSPMGTVMSALSRARRRLRHELVEYGRERGLLTPGESSRNRSHNQQ